MNVNNNNNLVFQAANEPKVFNSSFLEITTNNISRFISKGLDANNAEKILREKIIDKVVLFRTSATEVDKMTMSLKLDGRVMHLRFSKNEVDEKVKELKTRMNGEFVVIVKDDKKLRSKEDIESFKYHSFPPIGSQGAKDMIKDQKPGTYLFRVSSCDGADGENKTYSITFKTDQGKIYHSRLGENGVASNDDEIVEQLSVLEVKFGVNTFLPNTYKMKSARNTLAS